MKDVRAGLDPAIIKDLTTVGIHHFENGLKQFGPWSQKMLKDFGPKVKPYLEEIWSAIPKEATEHKARRVYQESKAASGATMNMNVSTAIIVAALLLALAIVASNGIYEFSSSSLGMAQRYNKFTGDVSFCRVTIGCKPFSEWKDLSR